MGGTRRRPPYFARSRRPPGLAGSMPTSASARSGRRRPSIAAARSSTPLYSRAVPRNMTSRSPRGAGEPGGEGPREGWEAAAGPRDVAHAVGGPRRPDARPMAWAAHLALRDGRQQWREGGRPPRRIVGEVEAEDGDLHAARSGGAWMSVA